MKRLWAFLIAALLVIIGIVSAMALANNDKGDINDNGQIDMTDYILAKRAYFNTFALDAEQFERGDINGNDEIDMSDYVIIKRMYFGTFFLNSDIPEVSEEDSALINDEISNNDETSIEDETSINDESAAPDGGDVTTPDDGETITPDDGTTQTISSANNVAAGKPYTTSLVYCQNPETWEYDASFGPAYPDTDGAELTDGKIAANADFENSAWIGLHMGTPDITELGYAWAKVDLQDTYNVTEINLYVASANVGAAQGVEIGTPASVTFVGYDAGGNEVEMGDATIIAGAQANSVASLICDAEVRYIEARLKAQSNYYWIFISEMAVLTGTSGGTTTPNTGSIIPDTNPVVTEDNDILLCYIAEEGRDISISKDTFLPAAGYYKDGEIQDYMFESFIFLCQPNYIYNWDSNGNAYLKSFTKQDWEDYINNYELADGKNIDALDAAVGEIKAALNDSDYKAKVYMTLLYPVDDVTQFGYVNGELLDFSNFEDRCKGMQWMVDESISRFNAQNYQNIELAGFYWFCEEIYDSSGDGRRIAEFTADYVRYVGLKTAWCPYFWAEGYDEWYEIGFDIATQQANYFPEHRTDWPNKGGAERLRQVAAAHKNYDIGVGMEMADLEVASAVIFQEYMQAAIEYDFMECNHIYYMSTGPDIVSSLSSSSDETLYNTYHLLYKYLRRTLTLADFN